MKTISAHPGLFSKAWLNVQPFSKLSDGQFENMVLLQQHRHGLWLVAVSDTAVAASWVSSIEGLVDNVPRFDEDPLEPALWIGDGDGSVTTLMKAEWSLWKKSSADAGFDDYLTVCDTADPLAGKSGRQALPGTARPWLRLQVGGNRKHVDAPVPELPAPAWGTWMRSVGHGLRGEMSFDAKTLAAVLKIEGKHRLEFGEGAMAMVTVEPHTGDQPPTFVRMLVGKREGSSELEQSPGDLSLTPQRYDDSSDSYIDDSGDDDDDTATPFAETAVAGLLEELGVG